MRKIEVHNHGHVVLEKSMGSDVEIAANARVSFDTDTALHVYDCPMTNLARAEQTHCICNEWPQAPRETLSGQDRGLIGFLMRERHGSPFEAPVFRFDIKAPLFVIREFQRHRHASYNEQSARYSEIPEHFYIPDASYIREQVGTPGNYSFGAIEDPSTVRFTLDTLEQTQRACFEAYRAMLNNGVAKELARTVLPVGMFSRMKVTMNLRGLLNFLSLRNHPHAQAEIKDYAIAMEEMVNEVVPVTMDYFRKYDRVCP